MTVNILGTEYTILVKNYEEDEYFAREAADGYRDGLLKEIVLCDSSTYPGNEHNPAEYNTRSQKQTLRHEIVHAFLYESGLDASAGTVSCGWPLNEEMVDWFAIQGPKIYAAWQEVGAL